ncbi:MAG: translation initiation factor IF-5A [Candidatus Diapherotrites archaeon]
MEEEKKFASVSSLKTGSYVLIDGFPCAIKSYEKSKPGKHGAAKARITAMGLFDNQKRTLLKPTSADAEVPIVKKANATVVALMGDLVQIMDAESYETMDCKKPDDVKGLEGGAEVEYMRYGKDVKIIRKK